MASPGPGKSGNQCANLSIACLEEVDSKCQERTPQHQKVVLNGLQLSLKRQKQAFVAYNYAPLCMVAKTDWKVLAGEELECQHIRYHQLQPEDDITAVITSIKKTHAVGAICVNTEDSTDLTVQYDLKAEDSRITTRGSFPVILLSSSDGTMLQESLNNHDMGEIYGKIEVKNQSDVKLLQRMLPIRSQSASSGKSISLRSGFRGSLRRSSKKSVEINLKELVKMLMLHVDGAQCVSEDLALFQHLITAFYQYEQMAKREGTQNDGGVFRKLSKHMETMFERDFPFYVTIAYRVLKKLHYYECDELSPFVQNCVMKFERLPPQVIAETLKTFLTQDNFRVMVEPNSTLTVFELLEVSCVHMMEHSASLRCQKTNNQATITHRQLYGSMLWLSVAYKCHVERGSRIAVYYWREHVTSKNMRIYLNPDSIHSIRTGMEFGKLLELPQNVSFNGDCMGEILADEGYVRPFSQIRECAVVLEQCFSDQEEFVVNFINKPRLCYQAFFSQPGKDKLRNLHPDGNLLVILQEGLLFLDSIISIIRKRLWQNTQLDEEMKEWIYVLLSLVDITSNHVESYLKDFLTTKSGGVTKLFREHIKRTVIGKVQENISKLDVEQFFDLYQAFLIWPTWLVEQYLQQYKIPPDVKICSITWRNLFSEFVDRFDSNHQRSLLEFLMCVGSHYQTQCRATEFVLDLLNLDVPSLFVADLDGISSMSTLHSDIMARSVSEDFFCFLCDYIQRNNLSKDILDSVESVWVSLAEHSDFQNIILNALQEELIPGTSSLMEALMSKASMRFLIEQCVTTICQGIGSLKEISSRTNFCWGVLASCCNRITISDTFEWVHLFTFVIDQLGRVYGMYCEFHGFSDKGTLLVEGMFPKDITESSCEEVRRVFQWICNAQSLLTQWTLKFNSGQVNYDEIELYHKNFSNISRVSSIFSANADLTDMQSVVAIKLEFNQTFELLNTFMIRYIPARSDLGWCGLQHLLTTYGIRFPSEILSIVSKHVLFPGDNFSEDKLSLSCKIPASITNTFQPGLDVALHITKDVNLLTLKKLLQELAAFLSPIEDNLMQMLVFFYLNESTVFEKYLHLKLGELDSVRTWTCETSISRLPIASLSSKEEVYGIKMEEFASALFQTHEYILKLITGTATYVDVVAEHSPDLKLLNTDHEFQTLKEYAHMSNVEAENLDGLIGFKAMLRLFQLTRHVQVICDVCVRFQLKGCLEDPKLRELQQIVRFLEINENKRKLTTNDAIEKMHVVKEALFLDDSENIQFLNLFTAVADSPVFYHFVVEKEFIGEDGQALFNQQYQLITTQLQHEEYNEVVLNHLFAAFKLITPFMDQQQTFDSLMSQVVSLGAYNASKQLETVNRNINLIRLWFSKAEGDTVEGVSNELKYVMETGYYQFSLTLTSDGVKGNVELLYQRSVYSSGETGEGGVVAMSRSSYLVEQRWSNDNINDFVQKLGFLDVEGEIGDSIDHFVYLNQTARKLIAVYVKLKELGHPEYLKENLSHNHVLPCALCKLEADHKVQQARTLLLEWEHHVAQLRAQYSQLLFFSVPKVLVLYHFIKSEECCIDDITKEVGFLFRSNPEVQMSLKEAMKELLQEKGYRRHNKLESTPMHVVGAFLSQLFHKLKFSTRSFKRRRPSITSVPLQSFYILHSCEGYNQSKIIRLIIHIYGGVPEVFEVLRCRKSTTKEEIQLFLNPMRVTKQPYLYLILEVNKLSYQLQESLLELLYTLKQNHSEDAPCIHFIETGLSILHEVPYVLLRDYRGHEPSLNFNQAMMACQRSAHNTDDFSCIKLVYGKAGDGKTHYIKSQLSQFHHYLKITVNESFVPLDVIRRLCSLPFDVPNCAVFFNITLIPPGDSVDKAELEHYHLLLDTVGWFFFELFLLGCVEDPATGQSFRFPDGMKWAVYIEVPSRNGADAKQSLEMFFIDIPALGLLGTPHEISPDTSYSVDEEVQLVCKYLNGYHIGGMKGIDRLYKEGSVFPFRKRKQGIPVKLSQDPELTDEECHILLQYYIPENMKKSKLTQKLFVKYMKRRCEFLDNCPGFNYNTGTTEYTETPQGKKWNDTKQLGSTLMCAMLNEVSDFCDPIIRENWALKPHHKLIYDFKDGGCSFAVMSLHPDQISSEDVEKFRRIWVEIPSMMELYSRRKLDSYLSRALNVPLDNGRLTVVDDANYVLTLDFAIKILNIHERAECCVPVIIEGETGVGKTALVEMLSKLWNYAISKDWNLQRSRIVDILIRKISELSKEHLELYPGCIEAISAFTDGKCPREDDLILIGEIADDSTGSGQFYSRLRDELLKFVCNPFLSLIMPREEDRNAGIKFSKLFAAAEYRNNSKDTGKLLFSFLNAEVKPTFHKLNIHSALKPEDIISFLRPACDQANDLHAAFERSEYSRTPFVTVFLDEINTSSCLGLFKELVIDRTLNGEPIPDNLFLIAACNPHRGNSLFFHETSIQGSYYVRLLHPSIQSLMWDYGALGMAQEREYIQAKLCMTKQHFAHVNLATMTDLIVTSQNLIRTYAVCHMTRLGITESEAHARSRSCVSQRDIQRIFTFAEWLCNMYSRLSRYADGMCPLRAILVSLGIVYYLKLDSINRKDYRLTLDHQSALLGLSFSKAFDEEVNWYINHIELPEGIAHTVALKENIFATIVCTMTHTPLIMIGSPGSSKTLSFNITVSNMKGMESKVSVFRNVDIFKSLDPQVYQCSRRTTSNEISTVFSRAINRQRSHFKVPLPVYCVVFMDEAGLPEERHESLKVLHYFLDTQEVSFVGVSNHALDAAKTNRAVTLFRPEASSEDLIQIARGCFCAKPSLTSQGDIETVTRFCQPYEEIMSNKKCKAFFGLRDFIHFISYLRQKKNDSITPQLVMEAIERNFNGLKELYFKKICQSFLHAINSSLAEVNRRNIIEILCSSLTDHPIDCSGENQIRYKLIVDDVGDGSVLHLLVSFGMLRHANTKMYMLSDFPEDIHLQEINTIAAIRHSATEGHTIIMSQTDSIHESFYDLFNHRFHRLDASDGTRFYSNIAIGAHIKPCRIHQNFQCIVVVKKTELGNVPPPFLNRFEKYFLSYKILLDTALNQLPPFVAKLFHEAERKVTEFAKLLGGPRNICGYHSDTLKSLILTLLPPVGFKVEDKYNSNGHYLRSTEAYFMETLLHSLNDNAGFRFPTGNSKELSFDSEEVFKLVCENGEFAGYKTQFCHEVIAKTIKEGLHTLFFSEPPLQSEARKSFSVGACMTIQLLSQWLTRLLCKRVLQLATPEAVCLYQEQFPSSYLVSYLNHQHHFSLKSLLEAKFSQLSCVRSSSYSMKLVCFTQSSQLLHQVPSTFPKSTHVCEDQEKLIKHLFFSDTKSILIHKLSSVLSYVNMKDVIANFSKSRSHSVLVLIVNMQETSTDVIHHIRLLIEEVDNMKKMERKLFTLVLHTSASTTAGTCYNALYLQGWDFHYIDVIGSGSQEDILDISLWFHQCYLRKALSHNCFISLSLKKLLHEALAIVTSRLFVGSTVSVSFNRPMTVVERNAILEELLIKKGVGTILIERFNTYWQPNVMLGYLRKAAKFVQNHERNATITDYLKSIVKRLFIDFIVYMIYKINDGMNFDIICDPNCPAEVLTLFISIIKVFPIPKLSELDVYHISECTLPSNKAMNFSPAFPFFLTVANSLEEIVNETYIKINHNFNRTSNQPKAVFPICRSDTMSRREVMKAMIKHIHASLLTLSKSDEDTCLNITLRAILKSELLWEKYLEDFTRQKLHLDIHIPGISPKIMLAAFGKFNNHSILDRLAILHSYVHVYRVNLSQVVAVLGPLDKIEVTESIPMSNVTTLPIQSFVNDVEGSGDFLGRPETLSTFVIETLFCTISFVALKFDDDRREMIEKLSSRTLLQVELWYMAYREVMTIPTLHNYIYRSRVYHTVQAKGQHNLMHILFLMFHGSDGRNIETVVKGLDLFVSLCKQFFSPSCQIEHKERSPKLKDILGSAFRAVTGFDIVTTLSTGNSFVSDMVEALFAHFFSEEQTFYDEDDVQWFLEVANRQYQWQVYPLTEVVDATNMADHLLNENSSMHSPGGDCMLLSTFKFYFMRIIRNFAHNNSDSGSLMFYFKENKVHDLMKDVLLPKNGSCPCPYIPTFYQGCTPIEYFTSPESELMQRPLAHLYFFTVFEDLLESNCNLCALLKISQSITKQCKGGTVELDDVFFLHIENQAVIQVMIKELARHLDLLDESKINTVCSLLGEINEILDDVAMGGGKLGGHGIVLGMHILKELGSFQLFTRMLTDQFHLLCEGISCLESYHEKLRTQEEPMYRAGVENIYLDFGSEFRQLYTRISRSMHAVHTSNGNSFEVKELSHLVWENSHHQLNFTGLCGKKYVVPRSAALKIAMWLSIYNDYFSKQVLLTVISQHTSGIIEEPILNLFAFFLYPPALVVNVMDPLYSLFLVSSSTSPEDHHSVSLRAAIVKMVAVTVGLPPKQSHMWFYLFEPEKLLHTYLSAVRYEAPVGPTTYFLDSGLECTQEGFIIHREQRLSTFSTGLSIHSHHLLLMMNFGLLCVHMLQKRDADKQLTGIILSERRDLHTYCSVQLRLLWAVFGKFLALSFEDKRLLVELTLLQQYEVFSGAQIPLTGQLCSVEDLKRYEKLWQTKIFEIAWKFLRNHCFSIQNEVFTSIKSMNDHYPWLPDEDSLPVALLRHQDLTHPEFDLESLTTFLMSYKKLQLGCDLLPLIAELYQWLHTELSYSVTYSDAAQYRYGELSDILMKRSTVNGDKRGYFDMLKDTFNKYANTSSESKPSAILTDETSLLNLLSCTNDEDGIDILFSTVVEIITLHNYILTSFLHNTTSKLVPSIHAVEFIQSSSQMWSLARSDNLVQLIRSCSHFPLPSQKNVHPHYTGDIPGFSTRCINLSRLQSYILAIYIAGKPKVITSSIVSIRVPFKFKEGAPLSSHLCAFSTDLQWLSQLLPNDFKIPLNDAQRRLLQYEFHMVSYDAAMEIVTGLRAAIGHLQQELASKISEVSVNYRGLKHVALADFVSSLYHYEPRKSDEIFNVLGIYSLSPSQRLWLKGVKINNLFDCWRTFFQLVEDGWYQFSSLPFGIKQPMNLPDEDAIMQIPSHYIENNHELLTDVEPLLDALHHLERYIVKTPFHGFQVPITRKLQLYAKDNKLIPLIPDTIRTEHYVSFRIVLRKMIVGVGNLLPEKEENNSKQSTKWTEYIDEIWQVPLYTRGTQRDLLSEKDSLEALDTSVKAVVNFLEDNTLGEYVTVFESNEIDCEMLLQSSDRDLEEIGVLNPIHRLRITFGIKRLIHGEKNRFADLYPAHVLVGMFDTHVELEQFCACIIQNNIDGEMLLHASDPVFRKLGIIEEFHLQMIKSTLTSLST